MPLARSWIEINLSHFEENLKALKGFLKPQQAFLQIVKADAYGHGAFHIAQVAIKNGASLLGVANADEGANLRYQGITLDILILSPSLKSEINSIIEYNLTPSINDIEFAELLNQEAIKKNKTIEIHINIDTGMNRSGIKPSEAKNFIKKILSLSNLKLEGIFTHFAESEDNNKFTHLQYNKFIACVNNLKDHLEDFSPRYIHSSNSCGLVNFSFDQVNLVRLGILTFGIYPIAKIRNKINLKPVMKFLTTIGQIKSANAGEHISYNMTYTADEDITYAILPVGYADGYPYHLGNKGFVECNNEILPVIGKVTMDMTIIKQNNKLIKLGDNVTLFGSESIHIEDLAQLYKGSPYELATLIGRRAVRLFFYNNKQLSEEPIMRRGFFSPDFSKSKLSNIIKESIKERIESNSLSTTLYNEIIDRYIRASDRNTVYRKNFNHEIQFIDSHEFKQFYKVKTKISYNKILKTDKIIVACANNNDTLNKYFQNPQVEYRWLLAEQFPISNKSFVVTNLKINDISTDIELTKESDVLEYSASHDKLKNFVNSECSFVIETETYYPKSKHQLAIYISEPTLGVKVAFKYPNSLKDIEVVNIISGETKYPSVKKENNTIEVDAGLSKWILPNSGIIFSY